MNDQPIWQVLPLAPPEVTWGINRLIWQYADKRRLSWQNAEFDTRRGFNNPNRVGAPEFTFARVGSSLPSVGPPHFSVGLLR